MSLFSWFHRRQRVRSTDSFHVQQIKFVGEQDGAPEQELTGRLTQLFQNASTVKKAYLAGAGYGTEGLPQIVLCLRTDAENKSLVVQIGDVFASLFRRDVHMDILFVNDTQERSLQAVCRPFWCST